MFNFLKPLQACFNSTPKNPNPTTGTVGCGWAELEPFVQGILGNLVVIGMFVASFMVAYAGYVLLKGQGDAGARSKARDIFINVIIGAVILFSAYYIVDLILTNLLVDQDFRKTL